MKHSICPICDKSIDALNYSRHYNRCAELKRITPDLIDSYVNKNMTLRECHIKYGSQFNTIRQILITNGVHIRNNSESRKLSDSLKPPRTHTEETKLKISAIRKKYLKDNPDKHPWKLRSKFVSQPCEHFKKLLTDNNITFIAEYTPDIGRHYSIDIAFPDVKVGIEINGNQHYNKDKTLKPYYQARHQTLIDAGWQIFEYHYSIVYDESLVAKIVASLKTDYNLGSIDYSFYIREKNVEIKKHLCIDGCGALVFDKGCRCRNCYNMNRRKTERPPYEQLLAEFESSSYTAMGKKYGVSGNAVKKWIKNYENTLTTTV